MAAMKDSGVDWIGAIPGDWQCEELRYLVSLDSHQETYSAERPYLALENIEPWTGKIIQVDAEVSDEATVNCYGSGDVLFGKLRPYLAKVVRAHTAGTSSSELLALTPVALNRDYLFYAMLCKGFIDAVNVQTYGVKMPRTSWDQLRLMRTPLPPLGEQERIANQLDAVTGQIDSLVDSITHQLDVLADYRKSLIQEVVTHGLNPSAEMRPSGIDWIGDIPAHWQTSKLRYITSRVFDGPFGSNLTGDDYSDEGVRVVRLENLKYLDFDDSKKSYVSEEKYRSLSANTVYPSDLIMATFVQDEMDVCILPGYVGYAVNKSDCIGIRLSSVANQGYFHFYLSTDYVWQYLRSMLHGATRGRVNTTQIKQIPVLLPPLAEQQTIADYLDAKTSAIDRIAAAKRRQLDNLREQRQSIIYEYVAGKRRVV